GAAGGSAPGPAQVEPAPADMATEIRPAPLAEPAPLAAVEPAEPRRPIGSFRLGGRPVQLSDEPESASA
ncbi:hypothetical protein, partial [Acidisphaera rubrifaciens]|uniref:hypothetical protein n=1 Tax=Acidisphaera rubrifaciens TaxID=50715 RepID=UPI0019D6B4AB